jgi:hypothetical protein
MDYSYVIRCLPSRSLELKILLTVVITGKDLSPMSGREKASWEPEPDDEDFERNSRYCFLTGISDMPPDNGETRAFSPIRHQMRLTAISDWIASTEYDVRAQLSRYNSWRNVADSC